jgi:hypothetical protein
MWFGELEGHHMWTGLHRRTAERKGLRYPSDLSEAEWRLVAPLVPPAKRGGRKRSIRMARPVGKQFPRADLSGVHL